MNRPNILIRFVGSPAIAFLLFAVCGFVIYDWRYGPLVFWEALMAVGVAYRTLRCFVAMRRYKAWAKEWRSLQAEVAGNQPVPKAGTSKFRVVVAVLLFVAIPMFMGQAKGMGDNAGLHAALTALWGIDFVYLTWLMLALFGRTAAARKERSHAKADSKPVTWALGRASGSPSREQVRRQLPDYALRVMAIAKPETPRSKTRPAVRIAAH